METASFRTRFLRTLWQVTLIFVGSVISAGGMILLLEQHKLLAGGVTGISMMLSFFTPLDAGVWVAILNVPLFVMAWRKIDLHFCVYSLIGTAMMAGLMVVFSHMTNLITVKDPLLAALFGGMLSGGGTGLVIRARGSHGGTDIVSVIIRKRFSVGIGMFSFYINVFLVAILSVKFGVEIGLLTIFSQFVAAKSLDRVVTGFNTAKSVTIISDHAQEISDYILKRMVRGVTFLEGKGGYDGKGKQVIWCVVTTSQLARVKGAIRKIDPGAFLTITDASEIIGKGFYEAPF